MDKINNLKKTSFSRQQLTIFILIFAAIGGYLLYRSFAAAPLVASLEGEQMTLSAGGTVLNDASASAGKLFVLSTNGTASGSVNFPSSVNSVSIIAKGDQCSGAPVMSVTLDGANLLSGQSVSSTSLSSYSATLATAVNSGTHNLVISFNNDYTQTKKHGHNQTTTCSRALYVDVTSFFGPTPAPPPAPTVSLSATPTSVTAGSASTLNWNSTNATSCTASGAWSGTPGVSGSQSTGALNQTSTYTLSCTGTGGSAVASVVVTVSAVAPPPATSTHGGVGIQRLGNFTSLSSGYDRYDILNVDRSGAPAACALTSKPGKTLVYMALMDINKDWSTGVPYTEAAANGWVLKDGSGAEYINGSYTTNVLGDVGNTAYASRWAQEVGDFVVANHCSGVYMDDVLGNTLGFLPCGCYPIQYPSKTAWQTAYVKGLQTIYSALHARGLYVSGNITDFTPGDGNSNTAVNDTAWWQKVGPSFDGLQREFWQQNPGSPDSFFTNGGTNWDQQWDSWQTLVTTAQNMGKDFYALDYGSTSKDARFGRGSFLLEWNGKGGAFMWNPSYTDPWGTDWTTNIGTPTAAKTQAAGGWKRTYTGGEVIVNPTTSTITVDGHVVGATDSYIGP